MSDRPKPPCVQRWLCTDKWGDDAIFQERADGPWVAHEDHAAALQSRDQRIAELEERVEDLASERDSLYGALKELRGGAAQGGEE